VDCVTDGDPSPKSNVYEATWSPGSGSDDVDPSSVNLLVSRLRRKLAGKSFAAQIETVSRYGYRLTTSSATR